jgi:hypothetical protein
VSPSWHAIEFGLDLLKEGLIWRIGNGEKVNLWRDNWIPRDFNLKIRAGKSNSRAHKVNQLPILGTNMWNEDLVKKVCYREDVD